MIRLISNREMQGIRVLTPIDPQTSETEGESCASQD